MLKVNGVLHWIFIIALGAWLFMQPSIPDELARKALSKWGMAIAAVMLYIGYRSLSFVGWCMLAFAVGLFYYKARETEESLTEKKPSSEAAKGEDFKKFNEGDKKRTLEEEIVKNMCPVVSGSQKPSLPGYSPSEVSSLFVLNTEKA